jgi:serine/threonine-protein kinase
VDALVLRALAKSPAERFDSMLELAGEVARIRLTGPLPVVIARAGGAAPTVRFEPEEAAGLRAQAGGLPSAAPAAPPPGDTSFAPVDIPLTAGGDPAPARRRRPRAAAAATLAAALVIVIALAWWGARGRAPAGPLPAQAPEVTRAAEAGSRAGATPAALAPRGEAATTEPAHPTQAATRPPAAARDPASRPARPRGTQGEAPAPKDPYAEEAGLKPDPFR